MPVYSEVLVSAFLINVFALASPLFIMNVYDRVVPNAAFHTLWVLATGMFIIVMFDLLMKKAEKRFCRYRGAAYRRPLVRHHV